MTVSEFPDLNEAQDPSLSDIELLVSLRTIGFLCMLERLDNLLFPLERTMNPSEEEFSPIDLNSILELMTTLDPP